MKCPNVLSLLAFSSMVFCASSKGIRGGALSVEKDPITSRDKQAVGEALTKALNAMQGHGSGSKYDACSDMFPDGKPPADPNSPTWLSCKDQFYFGGAFVQKDPLTGSEKNAVGAALTKALNAMQGHGGGSKYDACADMFPDGKPPADRNSPTWLSCKDQFYFGSSLAQKDPISGRDKQAVGEALTKALNAMQGHGSGSKWEACADMFPDGKPPADQNSPTWLSCKDQFFS
eukprot:CAMPEP_0169139056 /NCGR_PEP_ID=MMETSP1015-20121227/42710_1 /TAXON_ID=342587 /ORGANISM="Karlodinium micrum, Strain CCMP2283" /LENGTH=230 /DNA_ID=CAMNT_0009204625 /DNA_START=57 /DNA_END=749 /DNA_ORIENTATION=+